MAKLINESLDTLKTLITELAITNFSRDGTGLLLSQVGESIYKKHPELRNALGTRKLAEFIKIELADSVQILTSPANHIVKVILPANVTVDGDIMGFFPKREAKTRLPMTPRYNSAFWAAFSHPLAKGCTRLVGFEPRVHFEDIEGDPPLNTSKKVVYPDFVTDETMESDPAKRILRINEKITSWMQEHAVEIDAVSAKSETKPVSTGVLGPHNGSLLEVLFAALDETDLRRIQIPLDIVAKLHRRP